MRQLDKVLENINKEIRNSVSGRKDDIYVSAIAREGYAGGYYDAVCDVINALNGVMPKRRNYWEFERM